MSDVKEWCNNSPPNFICNVLRLEFGLKLKKVAMQNRVPVKK